jgi:hypothetical protein
MYLEELVWEDGICMVLAGLHNSEVVPSVLLDSALIINHDPGCAQVLSHTGDNGVAKTCRFF